MKFKQRWSNSAELDFSNSSKAVVDITASATMGKQSSSGLLLQVGKWNANSEVNFSAPWNADASLEFAIDGGVRPPVTVNVRASATLYPPQSVCNVVPLISVSASTTTQNLSAYCSVDSISSLEAIATNEIHTSLCEIGFDINVDRGIKSEVATRSNLATKVYKKMKSAFVDNKKNQTSFHHSIVNAIPLSNQISTKNERMIDLSTVALEPLCDGVKTQNKVSSLNETLINSDPILGFDFFNADYLSSDVMARYVYPPRSDNSVSNKWMEAEAISSQVMTDFDSQGVPIINSVNSYFEDAENPIGLRPITEPPIEPPKPKPINLNFRDLWNGEGKLDFLGIELDALIIMNTVIMYHTTSEGVKTYINPVSWSISNDLDSYAWTLNCSLYDNNILSLISTDDVFTLSVNDVEWRFNAFKYKRIQDGQFSGYNVTFMSQTQRLGYPLAQPLNISLDAPKGALQLVEETLGEVPLVNKGVNEWTLQADTVEFMQAEPKAIISEILKASGAVMLPSVSGDTVMIQPRYKVASWLMNELTDQECDVLLDGNYMVTDSGEIRNGTEFNAVTISGEKSGVVTKIVRSGTDGSIEANDYTTQIHQDHNTGLEYAKKIFSENGTIELAEISVGLDDNLLQSGSIVRIKHPSGDRTGVSLGVTVKGDRVENVLQTATIEFRL